MYENCSRTHPQPYFVLLEPHRALPVPGERLSKLTFFVAQFLRPVVVDETESL